MVIMGILMASVAIFGYKAIVWLNRLAIPGLVVLLAWLTHKIVTVYSDKLDSFQATGDISFFAVINLLPAGMAAALILGADYGRYVKSERAALGAPLSVIVFFTIIASLGVVSAAVAGNWDPRAALQVDGVSEAAGFEHLPDEIRGADTAPRPHFALTDS